MPLSLLMRFDILSHKLVSSVLQLGFTWTWIVWSNLLALRLTLDYLLGEAGVSNSETDTEKLLREVCYIKIP